MAIRNVSGRLLMWRPRTLVLRPFRTQPLVLLVVGVVLALVVAYSRAPFVGIDVGARYDGPFLSGFHDREYSSIPPVRRYDWPGGADRLLIETGLNPAFRMVVLRLDEWRPTSVIPRRLIAVYANEQRVDTISDDGGGRDFRVLLPEGLIDSSGVVLRVEPIADRFSASIPPVQVLSATLSAARTYRWTMGDGAIALPALGRGAWRVSLAAVVAHPDGRPLHARLIANGVTIAQLPDYADLRRLSVVVPASVVGDGDLTLAIVSDTFVDPRPLGVLIEGVAVTPVVNGPGALLPPWGMLVAVLVVAVCLYGSLRWVQVGAWVAAVVGLGVVVVGAWALIVYRFPMGFYVPRLALLMFLSMLLTPVVSWLSVWLFRRAGVPLVPWFAQALMVIFLVGFWLKAGGMVFPYMRAIDVGWHMDRVRWILDGNLAAMYRPGAFSESVMPVNEWGASPPVIPYSPFFHLFATVFVLFPWPMEVSANVFSAVVDTSHVFLMALLARKSGLSARMTLFGVLAYAVTPVTFLLHNWGNVPTTFGIWWTLVATVVMVVGYPYLGRRGPFVLLVAISLACMLFYTVMAAFHLAFVFFFVVLVLAMRGWVDMRPLRPLVLATGLAFVLSVLVYYGQYVPGMIARTLPYMATVFTRGPQSVGVERLPFSQYLLSYIPHLDYHMWPGDYLYYGVGVPLMFVVPGFWALRGRRLLWVVLAAWFSVGVLFLLAGYRISMVDKQLFYVLPAVMVCWSVYAERYWLRGRWGRAMIVALYAFTFVAALNLWVLRIGRSPLG